MYSHDKVAPERRKQSEHGHSSRNGSRSGGSRSTSPHSSRKDKSPRDRKERSRQGEGSRNPSRSNRTNQSRSAQQQSRNGGSKYVPQSQQMNRDQVLTAVPVPPPNAINYGAPSGYNPYATQSYGAPNGTGPPGSLQGGNTQAYGTPVPGNGKLQPNTYAQQSQQLIPAEVRMFSGCRDSQTSADVYDVGSFGLPPNTGPGGAGGACTNAMIACLSQTTTIQIEDQNGLQKPQVVPVEYSWLQLLKSMREVLRKKRFEQVPQLSTSHQLNLDETFSLFNPMAQPRQSRRKALLIGINYTGQRGALRGCHNDVRVMLQYLTKIGFVNGESDPNVLILMDDGRHQSPTHANILNAFRWISHGANSGDAFFVHYSGHGGSVRDKNGDEADGMDETLIPVDFKQAGQIIDDVVLKELVLPLPVGTMLTACMDCCHSGTIMDLPYVFLADDDHLAAAASGRLPHMMMMNQAFNMLIMFQLASLAGNLIAGVGAGGMEAASRALEGGGEEAILGDVGGFDGAGGGDIGALGGAAEGGGGEEDPCECFASLLQCEEEE